MWWLIKKILKAAIVLTLLVLAVAVFAYFYPEKFLCVDSGKNVSAEVIVILGGGVERPVRAAELFHAHAAPRILISGAGDDEIYRQILIANGVPAKAIEVENKSTTTQANAEFSVKILGAEKIHMTISPRLLISTLVGVTSTEPKPLATAPVLSITTPNGRRCVSANRITFAGGS